MTIFIPSVKTENDVQIKPNQVINYLKTENSTRRTQDHPSSIRYHLIQPGMVLPSTTERDLHGTTNNLINFNNSKGLQTYTTDEQYTLSNGFVDLTNRTG